jgi:hypothetical protein
MAAMNLELNQAGWQPCRRSSSVIGERGKPRLEIRRPQSFNPTAEKSGPGSVMMAEKRTAAHSGHEVPAGV